MQQVATLLFTLFIGWLLWRDRKTSEGSSLAIWIPIAWMLILASRPLSMWVGYQGDYVSPNDAASEGSAFDRNLFSGLIVAGLIVLSKRRFSWKEFLADNKWLTIFFLYFLLSTLWSDYTFVSFKRWVKNFGNVVMVLVILTEEDPVRAMRKACLRTAYILVPLSVLFIKYYGDIGRYYNPTTWTLVYGGVTRDKNELGASLIVFGVFIFWSFFVARDGEEGEKKRDQSVYLLLLGMVLWLLHMAQSSTSMVCTLLGMGMFWALRQPRFKLSVARGAIYICISILTLFYLQVTYKIGAIFLAMVGRDMTFTGRTEIWDHLLETKINSLMGVGFYSFWLGDRADQISKGWFFRITEAHNGYLETYLDGGFIGLILLIILLFTAMSRISKRAATGSGVDAIRLTFMVIGTIYNITEANFGRQSIVWVVFLMMVIKRPEPELFNEEPVEEISSEQDGGQAIETELVEVDHDFSRMTAADA